MTNVEKQVRVEMLRNNRKWMSHIKDNEWKVIPFEHNKWAVVKPYGAIRCVVDDYIFAVQICHENQLNGNNVRSCLNVYHCIDTGIVYLGLERLVRANRLGRSNTKCKMEDIKPWTVFELNDERYCRGKFIGG